MAFETFELELMAQRERMAHMPRIQGSVNHGMSVIGTVDGFDVSNGLIISVSGAGTAETDWTKFATGQRRKEVGAAAQVTDIESFPGDVLPADALADQDLRLYERSVTAASGTIWLAMYGYREEYGSREVVDLPAYQGKLYVGDAPGEVPEELTDLFVDDSLHGRILKPYPPISRHGGYDNPAFFRTLREILPVRTPASMA